MQIDSKLVEHYETLIREHLEIADKYKSSLKDLYAMFNLKAKEVIEAPANGTSSKLDFSKMTVVNTANSKAPTFADNLLVLFEKAQKPLTASEIRGLYNEMYKTNFDKVGFSPKLSLAIGKSIKKQIMKDNPQETRNYYGLSKWFNGNELKQEYFEKIKAGQVQLY